MTTFRVKSYEFQFAHVVTDMNDQTCIICVYGESNIYKMYIYFILRDEMYLQGAKLSVTIYRKLMHTVTDEHVHLTLKLVVFMFNEGESNIYRV